MITFNWAKMREGKGTIYLVVDVLMVLLVVVNLTYIIAEWHFSVPFIREWLADALPGLHAWYDHHLHENFLRYDIWFVSVFVIEFCIRWALAVKRSTYHRWFFYPFLHWYDVLGCIPLGAFRFLRIFRVMGMAMRLHKMGVIDLRKSYVFRVFDKYRAVIVEEISDRVVVNVLEGIQDELRHGSPVAGRILTEVLRPQKEVLAEWLSHRVRAVGEHNYERHSERLRAYVNRKVAEAVRANREVRDIAAIPLVGASISGKLEKAVAEITFSVIHGMMDDLRSPESVALISELADVTIDIMLVEEEDSKLNDITIGMMNRSIDIVKEQVMVKQWKIKEAEERRRKEERKAAGQAISPSSLK